MIKWPILKEIMATLNVYAPKNSVKIHEANTDETNLLL